GRSGTASAGSGAARSGDRRSPSWNPPRSKPSSTPAARKRRRSRDRLLKDLFVLEGFDAFDIATTGTTIHGRRGGDGPPVLLLHGTPETHLMWHRVAPELAEHFTVVATDLRGFGNSGTPPTTPDHTPYSMRAIALDPLDVMSALGYDTFSVVGHDRGARCAYRLAHDHPRAVARLA